MEKEAKISQESIKNWLKNKYNLMILGTIVLALVIRLYYFSIGHNQPIWWDESDYLAYAKNLAGFNVDWIVTAKHNSLYPFIVALFFKLGLSETIVKFFLQLTPSFLAVVLTYYIAKEMYKDRRIAIISSLLMATSWIMLFNTIRFHIDVPALFAGLLAIYVFWKGYENKEKIFKKIHPKWAIPLTAFLVVLSYAIRRGYFLFGLFFFFYILLTRNWKEVLKDKQNWLGGIIALILIYLTEKFIFISGVATVSQGYFKGDNPINFLPLQVFSSYFNFSGPIWTDLLLYLFWGGIAILSFNTALSFGYLKKTRKSMARADLFNILAIVITLAFFILILRSPNTFGDPRWYLPLAFSAFICISRAAIVIADYIGKYNKYFGVIAILLLIGSGAYFGVKQADNIIESRIDSFEGIREAGLLLREISSPDDLIIVQPMPQTAYYAERSVSGPSFFTGWSGRNEDVPFELFLQKIEERKEARYVLVSFSEPNHPDWMKRIGHANHNGQTVMASWEIPFMDTRINFVTGEQDIKQSATYEDITFNLVDVKRDIFIYEIVRAK